MEFKEYRAKTVNDAITDALIELGTTSDMIEYEIIEEGSSGLLGLFSKDAVVRVRRREEVLEDEFSINFREELRVSLKPSASKPAQKAQKPAEKKNRPEENAVNAAGKSAEKGQTASEGKAASAGRPADPAERKGTADAANPAADRKKAAAFSTAADYDSEKAADRKPSDASDSDFGKNASAAEKAPAKERRIITGKEAENETVNAILKVIFEKLDVQAEISTSIDEGERTVNINVEGENTGELIGKRGQTLDAIQYLLSLVVNKEKDSYYRVKLDTNNYRERRQKTLENLAKNTASKVKKTRRKVALEPMNPYERRVIHSYLQSDRFVTTKSEGEEPNRRVVVYYKKP